ncbi:MAG: aminotransferase class V-fold PLP-dependent enzyme [Pseudomonadota bacterium]|nr:aminotransferase class V-fold PLP-dependent enzyme [Pseudomonadota bacterium]
MRDEFPQDHDLIYLNHAGIAPWPRRTAAAVQTFAEENAQRGALHYRRWQAVEGRLRERLRGLIGAASAADIALLKNTSEGLSLVAYGLDWRAGDNVVLTDQEFPSNRIVWESLRRFGVEARVAALDGQGTPEQAIMDRADPRTRLIAVSSVQYASGLRMDLEALGAFAAGRGILLCVDAIQSLGVLPFDISAVRADFVVADGHKWLLAPEGVALFYCRPELREQLRLTQYGWHMVEDSGDFDSTHWTPAASARRFECGSPNSLGVHALEASLSLIQDIGVPRIARRVAELTALLMARIAACPELAAITPADPARRAGIVTFRHRRADPYDLWQTLMQQRVVCACRGGGIRFSPHFYNTSEELERALDLAIRLGG